jgi:hypothetical protein
MWICAEFCWPWLFSNSFWITTSGLFTRSTLPAVSQPSLLGQQKQLDLIWNIFCRLPFFVILCLKLFAKVELMLNCPLGQSDVPCLCVAAWYNSFHFGKTSFKQHQTVTNRICFGCHHNRMIGSHFLGAQVNLAWSNAVETLSDDCLGNPNVVDVENRSKRVWG